MSSDDVKSRRRQNHSFMDFVTGAPLLFIGAGATVASLGFGLYYMIKGDMKKQSQAMAGRLTFQAVTILLITATMYRHQMVKEEDERFRKEERQHRLIERNRKREEEAKRISSLENPIMVTGGSIPVVTKEE